TWSENGPETVLFWSRRVGAGDVHSRQDRAETLVERILRSAKALHRQKEGEHHACPEHTPYRRIRCQSPQGGPQDRTGPPHVLAYRIGGGGRGLHRRDRHVHQAVAVWLGVAYGRGAAALPADDPGRLRDAGGLSAAGQPPSARPREPHPVHGVVQRGARRHYGRAGAGASRPPRPSLGRRPDALPGGGGPGASTATRRGSKVCLIKA